MLPGVCVPRAARRQRPVGLKGLARGQNMGSSSKSAGTNPDLLLTRTRDGDET